MSKNVIKKSEILTNEQALVLQQESETILSRIKTPIIISVISLLLLFIFMYCASSDNASIFFSILCISAFVAYGFCGDVALKKIWSGMKTIAFIGWIVVPFPFDLVSGIFSMIFALFFYMFLPIIPIMLVWNDARMQLIEAKKFFDINAG